MLFYFMLASLPSSFGSDDDLLHAILHGDDIIPDHNDTKPLSEIENDNPIMDAIEADDMQQVSAVCKANARKASVVIMN